MTAIFAFQGNHFITMCGDGRVWDVSKNTLIHENYQKIHLLSLKNLELAVGTAGHVKVFEPCIQEMKDRLWGQNLPVYQILRIVDEITLKHIRLTIKKEQDGQNFALTFLERFFDYPFSSLYLNVQYLIGGKAEGETFLYRYDYRNTERTVEEIPTGAASYIGTNRETMKPTLPGLSQKLHACHSPACCEEILLQSIQQLGKAEKTIGGTIKTMTIV
ncbi:hypothetical protein ACFOU2_23170 [Bacillus songklensis]|uniref:Uncharacterized protein n=1 Tax=Bacillus songklensis TaxID=1069116 RepID=A0ABV8BAQ2_9BACI